MHLVFAGFSCNNACVFCSQGESREPFPSAENPLSQLARLGDRLDFDGCIAIVGGEPTLHDDLPRWIAKSKSLAARVVLQTNGRRLAYPGYAQSLRHAGLDACDISLHGCTAAMHDYHTSSPGSCTQTLLGIQQARAAGLEIGVTTVVTRSNFRHLEAIVRLAHNPGATSHPLTAAAPIGRALTEKARVVPALELVLPHLEAAIRSAVSLGVAVLAYDQATTSAVRRLFPGIGIAEPAALESARSAPCPSAPALPAQRPAAGRNEVHTPSKKSGEALQRLFPDLFQAPASAQEPRHG
ncbi:MAG: radical SAM protein [Elusimicrobia bacterium]|nr:radical SAM protein [Elusimicrobiota bacterium]